MDYTRHYEKFHSDDELDKIAMFSYYEANLSKYLPVEKSARILDLGCGSGLFLEYLVSKGYSNISGVDIDEGQIRKCINKGLNAQLTADTIDFLNSLLNEFDLIVSTDVIEHIPHDFQVDFIVKIKNSLKQNGTFICSVPNANSPLAMRWRYIDWTHHESFTEHSLDFLLYSGGFKNIEIYPMEFVSKTFLKRILKFLLQRPMRFFNRLQLIAELGVQGFNIPLSLNILAKARKE